VRFAEGATLVAGRCVPRDDNRIVFCRPDGSDPVVV
jgi:hypothetical protein